MQGELDLKALKRRTIEAWSLGDYDKLAQRVTAPAARRLVEACAISAGQDVLDVAAGTGNVAIRAAREGAHVTACDITPKMVERGAERSRAEGVEVKWILADVEQLPFEEGSFDCVTSAFGAMFAPRPDLASRELFRVLRPGGTLGMANWLPDSFVARQAAIVGRYLPADPRLPVATEWSDREVVAGRFDGLASSLQTSVEAITWEGESPEEYVSFLQRYAGPQVAASRALDEPAAAALQADLLDCARSQAPAEGPFSMTGRYVLVVAHKRG